MAYRQLLLAILSVILVLIFYNIGVYHTWLTETILPAFTSIDHELDRMSPSERMQTRYSNSYPFLIEIKNFIDKKGNKNPVVLLPPNSYMKAMSNNAPGRFIVPEPIVCYYLSGIRAVWPNSSNVTDANFAVFVKNNSIEVVEIKNKKTLNEILALFKDYTPTL